MTSDARRDQLLDVAMAVVSDRGFAGVSMQSVAARAGVTRPVVYSHFGSLHGLLEALVGREMQAALVQVEATTLRDLSDGDPTALVLDSLKRFLDAVSARPATWGLVLTPPEGAPELLRRSIYRGRARVLQTLTDAVRLGSAASLSSDAEVSARLLSAMADEYARLLLADPERFPPERLLAHANGWIRRLAD